ncbi:HmuY family protein [Winogradskyella sp.]|uniref:HmuY family protein n=1 Tax=Winogradskyella sp. TaxID=1883156 RepID=UPI00260585FC|nr:HmuY family protein [Winogradskyella sp.]
MKTLKFLPFLTLVLLTLSSCSDDDNGPQLQAVESDQVSNLFAPTTSNFGEPPAGPFAKFDFSTGMQTDSETDWDIAFRGTTIIVNGGVSQGTTDEPVRNGNAAAYIAESTFANVTEVNTNLLVQDSEAALAIPSGSDNGWYNYNFMTNVVSPLAGRILVFRTRDGRYAKVEILSYYQDAPANPDGFVDAARYYTFNYTYQPNAGETSFE